MFYTGSRSESDYFLFLIPDPNIFSSRILHEKFFLVYYDFRNKVLVLVMVKKIRDPEKIHPGSGSRIQRAKKHRIPDPQH
jgi:hypothetical protein